MALTQYIGSRYVPIFGRKDEESIEWDSSKPYEPLTIVLYQGNSYTSRQAVPAGIDILNEDFWAQTGNYNAQVEQYRREVRDFDGRITRNEDDIAALEETTQNLSEDVDAILPIDQTKLSNGAVTSEKIADNAVTSAKLNDNSVQESKIAAGSVTNEKIAAQAVGTGKIADYAITNIKLAEDSIGTVKLRDESVTDAKLANNAVTEGKLATGSVSSAKLAADSVSQSKLQDGAVATAKLADAVRRRFYSKRLVYSGQKMVVFGDSYTQDNIANSVNAYWPKRVAAAYNMELFNFAIAGAGFGRESQPISRQQTNCQNSMTADERLETAVVIVLAGCNDLLNNVAQADITSGITGFISWATDFFLNAEIFVVPFNWGFSKLTMSHNALITNIMNSMMQYNSGRVHVVPYAWAWNLGIAGRFQNEVHPNQAGYNYIAAHIMNAIMGSEGYCFGTSSKLNFASITGINEGYLYYTYENGLLSINGYIRPTNAGAQNIILRDTGAAPAILTPNDSLFQLPLTDTTTHEMSGNLGISSAGRITAYIAANANVNDVLCFNGLFRPEIGVNWSDYSG